MAMKENGPDFSPEYFRFTADLLLEDLNKDINHLLHTRYLGNINIILAALDKAGHDVNHKTRQFPVQDAGRTAGAHPTGDIRWSRWNGGPKPELSDNTFVEVQFGNGQTECGCVAEFLWFYDKDNPDCDILKYRVLNARTTKRY